MQFVGEYIADIGALTPEGMNEASGKGKLSDNGEGDGLGRVPYLHGSRMEEYWRQLSDREKGG